MCALYNQALAATGLPRVMDTKLMANTAPLRQEIIIINIFTIMIFTRQEINIIVTIIIIGRRSSTPAWKSC